MMTARFVAEPRWPETNRAIAERTVWYLAHASSQLFARTGDVDLISWVLDPQNYAFSVYMAPTLVAGVAVFLLGALVLLREGVTRVSLSFALLTLCAAVWLTTFSTWRVMPVYLRWK